MANKMIVEFFLVRDGKFLKFCRELTGKEIAQNSIAMSDIPKDCYGYQFFTRYPTGERVFYSTATYFGNILTDEEANEEYGNLLSSESSKRKRVVRTRCGVYLTIEPWDTVLSI